MGCPQDILPVVRKLGEKIIKNCAAKFIPHFLGLSQSVGSFSNNSSKVVDSVCQESYGGRTQNDTNVSGEIMVRMSCYCSLISDIFCNRKLGHAWLNCEKYLGICVINTVILEILVMMFAFVEFKVIFL